MDGRAVQVPRPAAVAPQFSQKLENVTLEEGATATLECHVTGHPEPGVRWYKEGRPLSASQKVEMRKQDGRVRLILYEVREHDSGRYTCIAQNHLGENSSSANIIVNGIDASLSLSRGSLENFLTISEAISDVFVGTSCYAMVVHGRPQTSKYTSF